MRKLFSLMLRYWLLSLCAIALVLPAFVPPALAQNWTTISASNITDLNQNKLAAGQLCFLGTDQNDNPISFNVGGGGQSLRRAYCSTVTTGVVTAFTVPNPQFTTPAGIYYRVTAKDSSTGQEVLRYAQVTFSGGSFNFDNYAPTNVGSFTPPSGTATPGNLTVNGNLSVTGTYGTVSTSRIDNVIIVDGVKYPFTSAGINQANTDAIALGAGAVVDARSVFSGTFTSEIQVGDNTGSHAVTLLLPPVGAWTFTMTGGTSCGVRVFGKSAIIGSSSPGSPLFTMTGTSSSNLYAVVCNDPTNGNYVRMEGFGIVKVAAATVVKGALSLEMSQDGTLVRSVGIVHAGGTGFFARGVCCGAEFNDIVVNGLSAAGSAPVVWGDNNAGPNGSLVGVSCVNCSIDHPGAGINNISFFSTTSTENVNFYNLYMEPNATDTTTPGMQIPANVHGVNIYGGEFSNSAGGSSAWLVDIANWAGPCGCVFTGLKSQTKNLVNDHITGAQVVGASNNGQGAGYISGPFNIGGDLTLTSGKFVTNNDAGGISIKFTSGATLRGTGSPGDNAFIDLGNVTHRNSNGANGGSDAFTGTISVGGGASLAKYDKMSAALNPASVAATTCAEQTFNPAGFSALNTSDNVYVNWSAGFTTPAFPVSYRVSGSGTLAITFCNPTGAGVVPTPLTATVTVLR